MAASWAACTAGLPWSCGAQVVGAVGSSPDRAEAAAAATGAERGFATLEELLAADLDLVHVCTPNNTHLPVTLQALEAGKHVICEKPLATSAKDAIGLHAAAQEAGRVATVPFVYRYHPMVRELRTRIAEGEVARSPACTAATCRTGSRVRTTRTGASTTWPGDRPEPSRTSARTGAT